MSWIRIPFPKPWASCRFFVFHHAGGMGNAYFQWHSFLPPDAELVIVDLPGRGLASKEKRIENFVELLPALMKELRPFLDKPFILFGHSLGALLAFELSQYLPESPFLRGIALSAFKPPTTKNLMNYPEISHLPDEKFIQKVNEIAHLPKEITLHAEALSYFLSLMRSDFKIIESYARRGNHARPFNTRALIFGGANDPQIPVLALKEWNLFLELMGDVRIFPGEHFFVFQNAQTIVNDIFSSLI